MHSLLAKIEVDPTPIVTETEAKLSTVVPVVVGMIATFFAIVFLIFWIKSKVNMSR
jgi:hypothetical protein